MLRESGDILDTLKAIDRGGFVERLNEELGKVVKGVFLTDGKGSLTIKLDLVPNGEGQVTVKPDVKAKVPIKPVRPSIFFATVDGALKRDDPRQSRMELEPDDPRDMRTGRKN